MRYAAGFVVVALAGCQASVQGDASVDSQSGANASLEADLEAEPSEKPGSPASASKASTSSDDPKPLLGARRDLTLAPNNGSSECSCLRVALGAPGLPAFRWKGSTPEIDQERQLVIALSSEGAGCPDAKGSRGASYWGYRRSGDDIVVYVENAIKNRPIQAGAVIPKPYGPGQVYVGPIKGSPYGKPKAGKGVCRVGNPGAPRTAPVGEDETGDVYPVADSSEFPE